MRHLTWCLTRIMWRRCFPKGITEVGEGREAKIAKPTQVHCQYHPIAQNLPSRNTERFQSVIMSGRLKVCPSLLLTLVMIFPGLTSR